MVIIPSLNQSIEKIRIGHGSHSMVYKSTFDGIEVAEKVSNAEIATREYNILKKLEHPNIIRAIASYQDEDKIVIVEELCIPYIQWRRYNVDIGVDCFKFLIDQVFTAVSFLHDNKIIHCDVKASNLLIKESDHTVRLVVADFSSAIVSDDKCHRSLPCFTETHCAWELLNNKSWDEKIDSWSLGCCIFEMVYNKLLFKSHDVVKNGKISKRNVKSYNNSLYHWALYTGELDHKSVQFAPVPFEKPNIVSGMKNSTSYHDNMILQLLKVYPQNRKKISEVFHTDDTGIKNVVVNSFNMKSKK